MKRVFVFWSLIVCWLSVQAQVPQGINYQGVARDASDDILASQLIHLELSLLREGILVYRESHDTETSPFGVFNVTVGQGTPLFGVFADIDWSTAYMELWTDLTHAGTTYTFGPNHLMSVPFALHAQTVETLGDEIGIWEKLPSSDIRYNEGNVGIGVMTPTEELHLSAGSSLLIGTDLTYSEGKYWWDGDKASLRSGIVDGFGVGGTEAWSADSVGMYSVAIGRGGVASGESSSSFGVQNSVSGNASLASGLANRVRTDYSFAFGENNRIYNDPAETTTKGNAAWGINNTVTGNNSSVFGNNNVVNGTNSMAGGWFCTVNGDLGVAFGQLNLITEDADRATSFGEDNIIGANYGFAWGVGNQVTGTEATAWGWNNIAQGVRSTVFGDDNVATSSRATAFGTNNTVTGQVGTAFGDGNQAGGYLSTVFGFSNESMHYCSVVGGWNNVTTGDHAVVFGRSNTAGFNGTAFGDGNVVTGSKAFAFGEGNQASGNGSTTWGENNVAAGVNSTVFGKGNTAPTLSETTLGYYSTNYTPAGSVSSWVATDRLFTIGNGANSTLRSDAMVLLKNGNLGLGVSAPQARLHLNGAVRWEGGINPQITRQTDFFDLFVSADINPLVDNSYYFGASNYRWIALYSATGTIQTSDARDKSNVRENPYGLEALMKLRPVSYTWNDHPELGTKLGLIAQELQEVIPEVVVDRTFRQGVNGELIEEETARLGVYYSDLIPVLVSSIQEQQSQIDELLKRITELESKIEKP